MSERKIGTGLILGIIFIPGIFAWFTIREGYSTKARIISFSWMIVHTIAIAIQQAAEAAVVSGLQ
mgnify:CR=1 FL=1